MMARLTVLWLVIVVTVASAGATPVGAQDQPPPPQPPVTQPPVTQPPVTQPPVNDSTGGYSDRGSNVTVTTDQTEDVVSIGVDASRRILGDAVDSPAVPAWVTQCIWDWGPFDELFGSIDLAFVEANIDPSPDDGEDWGLVVCPPGVDTNGAFANRVVYLWPLAARPPQPIIDWLRAYAYAQLQIPVHIGWAAPFGDEQAPFITQFPTWLWIEPHVWAPVQVTTPEILGIEVTATATPVNVTFTGAEGETINCGPNWAPIYNFNIKEEDQHSDCTLTYHHSSAVGDWTLTSAVTWEITWACNRHCGTGTYRPYTRTITRDVIVAELQAVLIAPPTTNNT